MKTPNKNSKIARITLKLFLKINEFKGIPKRKACPCYVMKNTRCFIFFMRNIT